MAGASDCLTARLSSCLSVCRSLRPLFQAPNWQISSVCVRVRWAKASFDTRCSEEPAVRGESESCSLTSRPARALHRWHGISGHMSTSVSEEEASVYTAVSESCAREGWHRASAPCTSCLLKQKKTLHLHVFLFNFKTPKDP